MFNFFFVNFSVLQSVVKELRQEKYFVEFLKMNRWKKSIILNVMRVKNMKTRNPVKHLKLVRVNGLQVHGVRYKYFFLNILKLFLSYHNASIFSVRKNVEVEISQEKSFVLKIIRQHQIVMPMKSHLFLNLVMFNHALKVNN